MHALRAIATRKRARADRRRRSSARRHAARTTRRRARRHRLLQLLSRPRTWAPSATAAWSRRTTISLAELAPLTPRPRLQRQALQPAPGRQLPTRRAAGRDLAREVAVLGRLQRAPSQARRALLGRARRARSACRANYRDESTSTISSSCAAPSATRSPRTSRRAAIRERALLPVPDPPAAGLRTPRLPRGLVSRGRSGSARIARAAHFSGARRLDAERGRRGARARSAQRPRAAAAALRRSRLCET